MKKIVTGLFLPDDVLTAVHRLTNNGFSYDKLSMMSSASELPAYLQGEPEKLAALGAGIGAIIGGLIGALTMVAATTISDFEPMLVTNLLATAVGIVVGGYLGSLYSVRAETQTKIDLKEALEAGKILLVIKIDETEAETAESLLAQANGQQIEIHTIP